MVDRAISFFLLSILIAAASSGCKTDDDQQEGRATAQAIPMDTRLRGLLSLMERSAIDNDPKLEAQFSIEFMSLTSAADRSPADFVKSLIEFEATQRNEKASTLALVLLGKSDISPGAILDAVAAHLEAPDPRVQKIVRRLLDIVDGNCADNPDFSYYLGRIVARRHDKVELEVALTEHMFTLSPSQALRTNVRASIDDGEQRKPFLWAGHVVDDMLWKVRNGFIKTQFGRVKAEDIPPDVPPQLELMAARPEWWARLWVAAVMAQHKELATPELITKLRRDDNELVRKFIEQVQPTPPTP
ncbi:MAG: hypothetical protein K2Y37_15905 [Pirellulales bacterium]|nr:hypothetical protein [Pirellulales bacterium]